MTLRMAAASCATLLLACGGWACGGDVTASGGDPSGTGGSGAQGPSGPGAGAGPGTGGSGATGGSGPIGDWELLVEGEWMLGAGSEDYTCVIATVPEDMYVHAFRPIAPEGTHHTVLTLTDQGADSTFPCSAGTNGQNMIYGSGVGTEPSELPAGVAVKLEAGDKVLLNLHLFNVNPETLSGTSGIEIQRMDPADVVHEARTVLAGTINLNIPAQSQTTETGYCTLPSDITLFGVGPHMHQLGTHMVVTTLTDAGDDIILDEDYSFDNQQNYPLPSLVELSAGDQVKVDCTYDNTTNNSVGFGDSSNAEMCFATLFLYPATTPLGFICAN